MKRLLVVAALAVPAFATLPSAPASAHPLGNFSVNRYAALTLHPDHIEATVAADLAELPTLQAPPATCEEASTALKVTAGTTPLTWTITTTSFTYAQGAGGLRTSRLTCTLTAPAPLNTPTRISITNTFRDTHIGWRELVASGAGLRLENSPLPTTGVSDELRHYPTDLLTSPPDTREATFRTLPYAPALSTTGNPDTTTAPAAGGPDTTAPLASGGPDTTAASPAGSSDTPPPASGSSDTLPPNSDTPPPAAGGSDTTVPSAAGGTDSTAAPAPGGHDSRPAETTATSAFLPGPLASAERWLTDAAAGRATTPLVGILAVLLALVLGAAHAALPGHGKTVMAAYLAGSQGRPRDAIAVGATVTATHTGGVLALGLLLTTTAGIAGEAVLSWLGVASGTLVTAIGAATLLTTLRRRHREHRRHLPDNAQQDHDHGPHNHPDNAQHDHAHGPQRHNNEPHDHDHGPHNHPDNAQHDHAHGPQRHNNGPHDHDHGPQHHHDSPLHGNGRHHHGHGHHGPGRWGLAGMGIAGGLVPSPTALVVLLGAAALGHTVFGVLLVLAYGLGMAATLTAAGLLLVRVRDRLGDRFRLAARWRTAGPTATAAFIVVVGLGLAGRALAGLA